LIKDCWDDDIRSLALSIHTSLGATSSLNHLVDYALIVRQPTVQFLLLAFNCGELSLDF
jgi:hypothetical protein